MFRRMSSSKSLHLKHVWQLRPWFLMKSMTFTVPLFRSFPFTKQLSCMFSFHFSQIFALPKLYLLVKRIHHMRNPHFNSFHPRTGCNASVAFVSPPPLYHPTSLSVLLKPQFKHCIPPPPKKKKRKKPSQN